MTHRAETILNAVTSTVTGLSTTGSNVERGRVWPVDPRPALSVFKGEDQVSEPEGQFYSVVRELQVSIAIHIHATGNPETALNQIAAEIFAALTVDRTLGLADVFDTYLIGDDAPEIDDSLDKPTARMVTNWRVVYEHSETSAEA